MKRLISILSVLALACCLFFSVSAESIINNDGLSYMMAFAGSENTGLNYLSSGFIKYSVNDDFILVSPTSTGVFSSSSFLSSVIYLKNTNDTYILHKGDSFKYFFSNFGFDIQYNGATYNASQIEAKIIFTYDDNTTLEVVPDFEFDSVLRRITLFGETKVIKNVQDIKLDCKFYPSSVGLSGTIQYMYYMMYPPDVSIELLSRESEVLGDIKNSIDNAVNGEVEPEKSPVDDNVNDMLEKEDELLQNTEEGRENVVKYITQAIAEIAAYSTAFVALNGIIDGFFFLPIIGPLIVVSLGLGIFALIVNLAQSVDRADRANRAKASKSNKGGK